MAALACSPVGISEPSAQTSPVRGLTKFGRMLLAYFDARVAIRESQALAADAWPWCPSCDGPGTGHGKAAR